MSTARDRHISQETLDAYLSAEAVAAFPINGEPIAVLIVDAPKETLRLEVMWDGEEPQPIDEYVHLSTDIRFGGGRTWATLSAHGRQFLAEAYPLLRSVVDQVQLEGVTFSEAVHRSIARYHELLTAAAPMSQRREVGLFGELTVLAHLIDTLGAATAMTAWRGGDENEEHDIGLEYDDVEIKTTTGETRRHWVGSLGQLRPTPGRPLWLVSIQLTGAGSGEAMRLPGLVDAVADRLPGSLQRTFRTRVTAAGFRAEQPSESFRLLRLRSTPACYRVDAAFPHLDQAMLEGIGVNVDRIGEVNYTIRLDGLALSHDPPEALAGLVGGST